MGRRCACRGRSGLQLAQRCSNADESTPASDSDLATSGLAHTTAGRPNTQRPTNRHGDGTSSLFHAARASG